MKKNFTALLLFIFAAVPLHADTDYRQFPDMLLRQAFISQMQGELKASASYFKDYLSVKDDPYARSQYAHLLFVMGKKEDSLVQAKLAHEKSSDKEISLQYVQLLIKTGQYKNAENILNDLSKDSGVDPLVNFYRSEIFEKLGNTNDTEVSCSVVLFREEEMGWSAPLYRNICLWRLVNIYVVQKKYERAGLYLIRFLNYNPDSIFARFVLAFHVYYKNGRYLKSQTEFEKLVRYDDDVLKQNRVDPEFLAGLLGKIYLLNGDSRCRTHMKKASKRYRNDELFMALYMACQNKNEKAYPVLSKFYYQENPDLITASVMMQLMEINASPEDYLKELLKNSVRFGNQNMHKHALVFALKALDVKKKNMETDIPVSLIYLRLSLHYDALQEYNRSILYLRLSLNAKSDEKNSVWNNSSDEDSMIMLAHNLVQASVRRYGEAEKICDRLIALNPDGESPYYIKGLIEYQNGRHEKAVSYYTSAIARNHNQYIYYFYRAIAYHSLKKNSEAEQDLKKILSIKSDFPDALNFLGFIYAEEGKRLEESLKLIKLAVDSFPLNGAYQDSLGWVYYRMGRLEEARFHLELSVQILEEEGSIDPEVYGHLGDVLVELKYPALARSHYMKAVNLIDKISGPGDDFKNQKMKILRKEIQNKISRLEHSLP